MNKKNYYKHFYICIILLMFTLGLLTSSALANSKVKTIRLGSSPSDTLTYKFIEFKKESPVSSQKSEKVKINIRYPVFSKSIKTNSINKQINNFVLSGNFTDKVFSSLNEVWMEFLREYKSEKDDFSLSAPSWRLDKHVNIIYNKNNVLSLKLYETGYTGGAHESTLVLFYSYNLSTGRIITLKDMFVKNYESYLKQIAEKYFRDLKKIKSDIDINEAGYDFENGKFHLNNNFAIVKKGLLFYYNDYEIASYAQGQTELIIPYNSLKSIIKKDSVLNVFIK